MIFSMTGFGLGTAPLGGDELRVEIRTVNHKFCELKARLPSELFPFEMEIGKRVKERLKRGAIDLFVKRSAGGSRAGVRLDLEVARAWVAMMTEAAGALGIVQNLGAAELAQVPGVVIAEAPELPPAALEAALLAATDQALDAVEVMRAREGEALAQDLRARVGTIRGHAEAIARLSPESIESFRQRLVSRLQELGRGMAFDPVRIEQEVVLFADRLDIAEELSRLASHLEQFEAMVGGDEPTGRRLEFLVQEIHREVNTTGSKSQSVEIAQRVVAMKTEIERIREQVANVA